MYHMPTLVAAPGFLDLSTMLGSVSGGAWYTPLLRDVCFLNGIIFVGASAMGTNFEESPMATTRKPNAHTRR